MEERHVLFWVVSIVTGRMVWLHHIEEGPGLLIFIYFATYGEE